MTWLYVAGLFQANHIAKKTFTRTLTVWQRELPCQHKIFDPEFVPYIKDRLEKGDIYLFTIQFITNKLYSYC